jgi:peptidoglycan hydrolase CwlO-like protein
MRDLFFPFTTLTHTMKNTSREVAFPTKKHAAAEPHIIEAVEQVVADMVSAVADQSQYKTMQEEVSEIEQVREDLNGYLKGELISLATSVTRMNQQMQGTLNEIRQHQDEIARKQDEVSRMKLNITHMQGLIAGVRKVQGKLVDVVGVEQG